MDYQLIQNKAGYYEISNKPSLEELEQYYAEQYYQSPTGQYDVSYSDDEIQYFKNSAEICLETLRLNKISAKSFYEIGAGEGFFADYLLQKGFAVSLNDFSEAGMKRFNPHLLPHLQTGDGMKQMESFAKANKTFDLISLDNVLEHVIDPKEFLSLLRQIMSENSVARITVPNDFSDFQTLLLEKDLIKNTWVSPPDHLSYFNATNLKAFCSNEGFEVLSVQCDFPIEMFLTNPNSHYYKDRSLGKSAHVSRVLCTNYMVEKNITAFVKMSENAAALEYGRDVTIYLKT